MDFKVNREILGTNEVVYDGISEQSVELDYILPDYFPDIFKMMKCQILPQIVSSSISGDKVYYDLIVLIKILYCSSDNNGVHSVEQKLNYSKTIDLGKSHENPILCLTTKVDYVNARAVNQRRLDMRGAVSTKVKVTAMQNQEIISDAYGMNIELKKKPLCCPSKKINTTKRINITEEFDLGGSKPSVINIIRSDGIVISGDKKIIPNKAITKGEVQINLLYSCKKDDTDSLEAMQFILPFSQIIDLDGIDDRFDCIIDTSVIGCEIISKENADGESKLLTAEVSLLISCTAVKNSTIDMVIDAYSTVYPCDYTVNHARIEKCSRHVSENHMSKAILEYSDGTIDCIYDAWGSVKNISARVKPIQGIITVMGNICYTVMARNNSSMPVLLETEQAFETDIPIETLTDNTTFEPMVTVINCSYNLASTNSVEVKAELRISGTVIDTESCNVITEINVDETKIKNPDGGYALKLYFADGGEDIWEIAKKYSTSVEAIIDENDLAEEIVTGRGMILIPIVY